LQITDGGVCVVGGRNKIVTSVQRKLIMNHGEIILQWVQQFKITSSVKKGKNPETTILPCKVEP
jgi:hypothetical protein